MTLPRLKHVLSMNDGGLWGDDPDGVYDCLVLRSTEQSVNGHWQINDPAIRSIPPSEQSKKRLLINDLLITKSSGSSDHIGKVSLVDDKVAELCSVFSNFNQRLRAASGTSSRYLFYLLSSKLARHHYITHATSTSGLGNLTGGIIGEMSLPISDLPTQRRIADFLDHKIALIDRLIEKKEKLIKLLEEYKQAIIHQAVTGRIDVRAGQPYPAYKPSGIEWLGDVPEHWEVRKIKDWLSVNCFNLSDDTHPDYTFDYLDIGSVSTGQLVSSPKRITFLQSPSRARRIVHEKDTIVSTVRTYLKAVWYACGIEHDLVASTGFAVLTTASSANPKFVNYACQSTTFTDQVSANSSGIVYPAISEAKFATLKVTVPPLQEQIAIADFLDHRTALIDRLIGKKQKLLELLREYRTRLIADAVTGKIDVREAEAGWQQENLSKYDDEACSPFRNGIH